MPEEAGRQPVERRIVADPEERSGYNALPVPEPEPTDQSPEALASSIYEPAPEPAPEE